MNTPYKYKVAVRCITYNQKNVIGDALHGFVMQQTNFQVVYMIIDDASTDGEQDVLRKWAIDNLVQEGETLWQEESYGDIAVASLKQNPLALFVILLLNENHYQKGKAALKMNYIAQWNDAAKYHALCEGDDYWIVRDKLQRQVDFLEKNPEYSMCFHNAVITYEDTPRSAKIFNDVSEDGEVSLETLIRKWCVPTASMVFDSSILPVFPVSSKIISGDWRLILHCAANGKVWAMKSVMSVYRKTYNTSSLASMNKNRTHDIIKQKAIILEALDNYMKGRNHDLLNKYIREFKKESQYLFLKKEKGKIMACLMMPKFVFGRIFQLL